MRAEVVKLIYQVFRRVAETIRLNGSGRPISLNLYSLVECLTQRRREAESAEKSQKSEGKERYDKKRPGNFFHPIGENNYDTN